MKLFVYIQTKLSMEMGSNGDCIIDIVDVGVMIMIFVS